MSDAAGRYADQYSQEGGQAVLVGWGMWWGFVNSNRPGEVSLRKHPSKDLKETGEQAL